MYRREPNSDLILEKIQPGVVVHAERQTGKTRALLQLVHERYHDDAIVVTMGSNTAHLLANMYRQMYEHPMYGSTGRSTQRKGPHFVSADNLNLEGHHDPVLVDEWWELPESVRRKLIESGRLAGAVGTAVHASQIPLAMPRQQRRFEWMRSHLFGCDWTQEEAEQLKRLIDIGTKPATELWCEGDMGKARIQLTDTAMSAAMKMSDGNPGALTVLARMFKEGAEIDPDDAMGAIGNMLSLDTLGIYGPRIWMLYKDVCGEDLRVTCAILRANQLGFLRESDLNRAIDNYGEGIDVPDLVAKVENRLPNFKRAEEPVPSSITDPVDDGSCDPMLGQRMDDADLGRA